VQLRQSTAIPAVSKGLGPTSRKRTRRQARRKDGNGDARLEPESSRKRDITKDNAEQIRSHPMSLVAQSDIMEETGQSQDESKHETEEKDEQKDQPAGIQSAADDECTVSSERDVERLNDSDVSAEPVCGTEWKTDQPETLDVNTEIEPEQLNSGVLVVLSDTECDASREVTALQDQVGPDHGDKEDENEQSHDNTSCLKASIPSTGEHLDQSDRKLSEQAHYWRKPPVRRSDQRSRHSEQLVKEKKIVVKDRRASRNMSDNNSLKLGADLRQRLNFIYRTHGLYKQCKSFSRSGTKAGFTQYGSRKHEKHDSFAKHSFRDHSSHYVMRHRNRGGKYQEHSSTKQKFSLDQSHKNYVHGFPLCPKTTMVQPLLPVRIPRGMRENSKSAQLKRKSVERRASPSERRHDTSVVKPSQRSHSTQSSSLSPLSVQERYLCPMPSCHTTSVENNPEDAGWEKHIEEFLRNLRRMSSCHTTSIENNPEDAGWEKRTEEFLRKLQEGSRRSAAPASYHYSHRDESELSDLSSVTSESSADYMDVDVIDDSDNSLSSPRTTCRDPVDWLMGSATDQVGNRKHDRSRGSKSKSKDRIESEVSKHQTSKDHRASGVKKTTTKMKVC